MPESLRLALVAGSAAIFGGIVALLGSDWLRSGEGAEPVEIGSYASGAKANSTQSAAGAGSNLDQEIRLANLELSQQRLREEIDLLRAGALSIESGDEVPVAEAVAEPRNPGTPGVASAQSLIAAGVPAQEAEAMIERLDELALARLEADYRLRKETGEAAKQARTDRRAIPRDSEVIREEFGDSAYDQYLYALNQPNRVEVASVLRDSTAQSAGVQNGDFLRSLDGEPLYSVRDLTRRIRQGDVGRTYSLMVERNGEVIETWVPGGPLGVRVNGSVAKPAG